MRLEAMDAQGISMQALSPNPLTYLHFIEPALANDFCRRHNDDLATAVAAHPDRFVGLAALPMQDVDAACAELQRAVSELGLLGGYTGTDFGTPLDDPVMDQLWSLCTELDVPHFLHPTQSGIDGPLLDPDCAAGTSIWCWSTPTRRRWRWPPWCSAGSPSAIPIWTCACPTAAAHAVILSKLRKLAERRPAAPEWIKEPGAFDRALNRLWLDCHITGAAELTLALEQFGTDRLVYGTNFGGWDRGTGPDIAHLADTLNTNATRLLRL